MNTEYGKYCNGGGSFYSIDLLDKVTNHMMKVTVVSEEVCIVR